jgi:hypothetical protein
MTDSIQFCMICGGMDHPTGSCPFHEQDDEQLEISHYKKQHEQTGSGGERQVFEEIKPVDRPGGQ